MRCHWWTLVLKRRSKRQTFWKRLDLGYSHHCCRNLRPHTEIHSLLSKSSWLSPIDSAGAISCVCVSPGPTGPDMWLTVTVDDQKFANNVMCEQGDAINQYRLQQLLASENRIHHPVFVWICHTCWGQSDRVTKTQLSDTIKAQRMI